MNHNDNVYRINYNADTKKVQYLTVFKKPDKKLHKRIERDLNNCDLHKYHTPESMISTMVITGTCRVIDIVYVKPGHYPNTTPPHSLRRYTERIEEYIENQKLKTFIDKI